MATKIPLSYPAMETTGKANKFQYNVYSDQITATHCLLSITLS